MNHCFYECIFIGRSYPDFRDLNGTPCLFLHVWIPKSFLCPDTIFVERTLQVNNYISLVISLELKVYPGINSNILKASYWYHISCLPVIMPPQNNKKIHWCKPKIA